MARGRARGRPRKEAEPNGQEQSQEATRLANTGARAEIIRSACRYIADQQAAIKEIQADIAEYKSTHVKGDLGMKASDFAVILRAYKLEDDNRDSFIDAIREGFAALGIGGQGDFLGALDTLRNEPRPERDTENGTEA